MIMICKAFHLEQGSYVKSNTSMSRRKLIGGRAVNINYVSLLFHSVHIVSSKYFSDAFLLRGRDSVIIMMAS